MLNRRHRGAGGVVFIFSSIIAAVIMTQTLSLSWAANAIAISDNYASIVTINTANKAYITNTRPVTGTNIKIRDTANGGLYSPLDDFNRMMLQSKIMTQPASSVKVSWNGKRAQLNFGKFKTRLGLSITPHQKASYIEEY